MRRSSVFAFMAIGSLAFTAALQAKPAGGDYNREYRQCMRSGNAGRGVTAGIMDCNGVEIDRQDARLNQAYRAAMRRSNPARKAALRASERAWITASDTRCRKEADAEGGGTLSAIVYSDCILEATINRRMWLQSHR
jgi:uncharacterized protein YecT (DUF1311 family)